MKYGSLDNGDITSNQKKDLYNTLKNITPDEVVTIDEHKMFLEVLRKLRQVTVEDSSLYGQNFQRTIKSLLSVGEDGVYSNSNRFIYELIQNVDDCDYENIEDCNLDIKFDYSKSPGTIVLIYNEKGFTPQNVFSITGIAEQAKNITADKVEIGEKGIGFKSVFGIADKVIIESGLFSFELPRDNFTVPNLRYNKDFVPVKGTRMTLEMSLQNVQSTFKSIIEDYKEKQSVLKQNPVLFLNKLTHLKIYFDAFRYIEFNVERKEPEKAGKLLVERDVLISADMYYYSGVDHTYSVKLHCNRYTMPVKYGKQECISRYGNNVEFSSRNHNLIVVLPKPNEDIKNFDKGLMYSFLPTQVKLNVPIVMHIPFKLDASRDYVDSQGKNKWFSFTISKLKELLREVYISAAHEMRQDVIRYIPRNNNYFFDSKNSPKVECLCIEGLTGEDICREKVFYTEGKTYEPATNVVAFSKDAIIEDPVEIYNLLNIKEKLFIPNEPTDMSLYGCDVINDEKKALFVVGLEGKGNFGRIMEILEASNESFDYSKIISSLDNLRLTSEQLLVISKYKRLTDEFENLYRKKIVKGLLPSFSFTSTNEMMDDEMHSTLLDLLHSVDLDSGFLKYLKSIGYKFYVIEKIKKDFAIAGKNGVVLSKERALSSFSHLASEYDENNVFTASLKIRQASDRLNDIDDSLNNEDYLRLLRDVRQSLKSAFGNRAYDSYLQIIKKAGSDKKRFFNELLQNADDCIYDIKQTPKLSLTYNDSSVDISYNEKGFTKENIRALTAIGESTKKLLLNGDIASIGEKGVGFKSVFGVASEVEIHSNGFDFKLKEKTPTIPEKCEHVKCKGTTMHFSMKESINEAFSDKRIVQLCICLRNIKEIEINGKKLKIRDNENTRSISFEGKRYHFERVDYDFTVDDDVAFNERSSNMKVLSRKQRIVCYIPKDNFENSYRLYVGLPTETECNVPLIIDAPFELTTSRDKVLQNRWNNVIREHMYNAIINVMNIKKKELRIDVLKFIKFDNQNGEISFPMFSDPYFSTCNWTKRLMGEEIFPTLFEEKYISLENNGCLIIPDVLIDLEAENIVKDVMKGIVIDTYHKSRYIQLLEYLGVKRSKMIDDLECIARMLDKIQDDEFRKSLYSYLYVSLNQQKLGNYAVYEKIKSLPIFPIKTSEGVRYIPFSNNIYVAKDKYSNDDILILETKILAADRAFLFTQEHINELTQEVFDAKYQNNLIHMLKSNASNKEKAQHLLHEFNSNRKAFDKCRVTLKGMIDEIPMLMASGEFHDGNKFINYNGLWLSGEIISNLYVDEKYEALAKYLGCTELIDIHYC